MDNCDGKQARKIGAATPLGMLFDHGCDALSTGIIALSFAKIAGVGKFLQCVITALAVFVFFLATLEQ